MERNSIIDNAQTWAKEANSVFKSNEAKAAGKALQEYHKDLPEIIASSSVLLKNIEIDAGESKTTSRRLIDSAVREIAGGGKEHYDPVEKQEIMRNTLRDVLIQEAAGYEITRRGGIDPSRKIDNDPDRGQGEKAIGTLRRLNVDIDNVLGHMTEHDLAKTSHGAYNKVSLMAYPHLMKALGTPESVMNENQEKLNQSINMQVENVASKPSSIRSKFMVEPVRRFQVHAPKRMPSFGRRMQHVQAMHSGVSM